jgi:hypothetical protein
MLLELITLAASQGSPAQPDTFELSPTVTCSACHLERKRMVTLDPDHAIRPSSMAIVGAEVLLIPDIGAPSAILRFELKTGRFIGEVGRAGRGPGEFLRPQFLAAMAGDSLFVFDYGSNRYSILTPRSYRYVRGAPVAVSRPSGATLNGAQGLLWVAAAVGRAEQAGYLLHLFTQDGKWVRSVVPKRSSLKWNEHLVFSRHLSSGPDGAVWAISRYGPLRIEAFNAAGKLLRRATYLPTWFPQQTARQELGDPPLAERPPFWIGDDRELWIASLVPDKDWEKGIIRIDDPSHGKGAPTVGDVAKLFDTMVEVFDLRKRRVLFRTRLDETVVHALPDGVFAVYREDSNGTPELTIERWTLGRRK